MVFAVNSISPHADLFCFMPIFKSAFLFCSVCHDLPEECEEVLENAYFTDITDITEEEMNWVVDGMKILMSRFNMETAVPKLYIHELDKDDMYSLVSLKFLFSDNIIINSLENLLSK